MEKRSNRYFRFIKEIRKKTNRFKYLNEIPISGYMYRNEESRLLKWYDKLPSHYKLIWDKIMGYEELSEQEMCFEM